MREVVKATPMMQLIKSLPGVGDILAIVIALEIGDINRFGSNEHLASYCGTVPRVSSSGDKTYFGRVRVDVNHYLKWAYIEAANCIALQQTKMEGRHVGKLLKRIQKQKGYAKAVVAVGRTFSRSDLLYIKEESARIRNPTYTSLFYPAGDKRGSRMSYNARSLIATSPEKLIMPIVRRIYASDKTVRFIGQKGCNKGETILTLPALSYMRECRRQTKQSFTNSPHGKKRRDDHWSSACTTN